MNSKKHALNQMKLICLVILISCVFACILIHKIYPENPGLIWVFTKAMFEAAVVGAMADWYAVVALFRYPMGIRLPHTAIIQKQKDSIGENLGEFVKNEFMKDEDVIRKVKDFDPIGKFFDFLSEKEKSNFFSLFIASALKAIVKDQGSLYLSKFFSQNIASIFCRLDAADGLSNLLNALHKNGITEKLLDSCLDEALQYIGDNKANWMEQVDKKGFWMANFIGTQYVSGFVDEVILHLQKLKVTTSSERKDINNRIVLYIHELKNNDDLIKAIDGYKLKFVQSEEFRKAVENGFEYLKKMLIDDLEREQKSKIVGYIHDALNALIKKYETDNEFNDYLNRMLEKVMRYLLDRKDLIAKYLAEQVKKWESEDIANKLELEIGKDLQYIRLSGTVVGGLVGGFFAVILHLL